MSDELDLAMTPDDDRPTVELILELAKKIMRGLASCLDTPYIVNYEFRRSLLERLAEIPNGSVMDAADSISIRTAYIWFEQRRAGWLCREDFEIAKEMEWPQAFAHICRVVTQRSGVPLGLTDELRKKVSQ